MASDDHLHDSKRLKLMNTTIDDLPNAVLGEILARLPSYTYITGCKFVSKHWCTVMSDPSFIGRFLCFQCDSKQTFKTVTLINIKGEEFLTRMSSLSKPLTPLFTRLMDFHHLEHEPVVVATYNDLVLCCASRFEQRDYYICNPYTLKWVPLPPPPQVVDRNAVGFVCDLPYYSRNKNDVQVNTEYRCRVVRILYPNDDTLSRKVHIFSSDTGVWREYAHNGMLYWKSIDRNFLIGMAPFMMDRYHYECVFTEFGDEVDIDHLGVYNGRLHMGDFENKNIWELNEQVHRENGKSYLEIRKMAYLDPEIDQLDLIGFDSNDDGSLRQFLRGIEDFPMHYIVMYDVCTGNFSKVIEYDARNYDFSTLFPVAVPWWPTPVPSLPDQNGQGGL